MIDVLVAGAGPVGLAAAIRARLAGLDVTVVDPREDPIDKACGEGLMPGAVTALATLGVHPSGQRFGGIRYVSPTSQVEARFRRGYGLGVRRTVLHSAMVQRANQVGVVRERARVTEIRQHAQHIEAAGLTARWLLAADGLHSPIRQGLGLDRPPRRIARFGHRRHYTISPWSDVVEVHWSRTAEAYVTPVGADTVGVAVLCGRGRRYAEVLGEFPELSRRLAGAPCSPVRAAGPLWQRAAARSAGRVLLVGDAAGYVDALTGEGIATGVGTADAAVECIVAGRPQDYAAAWSAVTRRYRLATATLVRVTQLPGPRRQLVPAAARLPRVFERAVHLLA